MSDLIQIIDNVIARHESQLARRSVQKRLVDDDEPVDSNSPDKKKAKCGTSDTNSVSPDPPKENIPLSCHGVKEMSHHGELCAKQTKDTTHRLPERKNELMSICETARQSADMKVNEPTSYCDTAHDEVTKKSNHQTKEEDRSGNKDPIMEAALGRSENDLESDKFKTSVGAMSNHWAQCRDNLPRKQEHAEFMSIFDSFQTELEVKALIYDILDMIDEDPEMMAALQMQHSHFGHLRSRVNPLSGT